MQGSNILGEDITLFQSHVDDPVHLSCFDLCDHIVEATREMQEEERHRHDFYHPFDACVHLEERFQYLGDETLFVALLELGEFQQSQDSHQLVQPWKPCQPHELVVVAL